MISDDDVKHIATLARLGLDEAQIKKFSKQLDSIFSYVKVLDEVDTTNVEATSQVTGLENVTRLDKVKPSNPKEELLDCSPLPIEQDQVKVKPVISL